MKTTALKALSSDNRAGKLILKFLKKCIKHKTALVHMKAYYHKICTM